MRKKLSPSVKKCIFLFAMKEDNLISTQDLGSMCVCVDVQIIVLYRLFKVSFLPFLISIDSRETSYTCERKSFRKHKKNLISKKTFFFFSSIDFSSWFFFFAFFLSRFRWKGEKLFAFQGGGEHFPAFIHFNYLSM